MNTSATNSVTKSARLRVKLGGGAAGLAIAGIILAACSTTSAGAAKSATSAGAGQYRQATYPAPATVKLSEVQQLRREHLIMLSIKMVSGNPGPNAQELRKEHLAR
jgi:hypothetical protein